MRERTDAELVAACRNGQEEAWAELVERFSRYVYAITQAYRLSPQDSEDVFQDVFARAWERLGTLRSDEAVRPWLAQLSRNCCVDRIRRGGPAIADEEADAGAIDRTIERLDEALAVRGALARLSPDCSDILDRFFCRDESYHTISEALELPSGTIASRISRCLGRLRDAFEGRKPVPAPSRERVNR
jgi:RNA polymerase sigma-70 factor (ECF subfamily)